MPRRPPAPPMSSAQSEALLLLHLCHIKAPCITIRPTWPSWVPDPSLPSVPFISAACLSSWSLINVIHLTLSPHLGPHFTRCDAVAAKLRDLSTAHLQRKTEQDGQPALVEAAAAAKKLAEAKELARTVKGQAEALRLRIDLMMAVRWGTCTGCGCTRLVHIAHQPRCRSDKLCTINAHYSFLSISISTLSLSLHMLVLLYMFTRIHTLQGKGRGGRTAPPNPRLGKALHVEVWTTWHE